MEQHTNSVTRLVKLLDGSEVPNDSEAFRHECEARAMLALPIMARKKTLNIVADKRGEPEAQRLRDTMMTMWIDRQGRMLAAMNPQDRDERLRVLWRENGGGVRDQILARMHVALDYR